MTMQLTGLELNLRGVFLPPGELGVEPAQLASLPVAAPSGQSQTEKDAYS